MVITHKKSQNANRIHSSKILLGIISFVAIMLAACSRPDPVPVVTTPVPTAPANLMPQVDPAVAEVLAALTPTTDPEEAQSATPNPNITPTSSSCNSPEDWVVYTIQPFDTLFSLAAQVGTTVEEIKSANCMLEDLIVVDETLLLPSSPPTPVIVQSGGGGEPLPVEEPTPIEEPSCSLACEENVLSDAKSPLGSPGGQYKPCQDPGNTRTEPWISFATENRDADFDGELDPDRFDRELGQRSYYFICYPASYFDEDLETDDINDIGNVTASITSPSGTQSLDVLNLNEVPVLPEPEPQRKMGTAQRVIIWNAVCDSHESMPPDGIYNTISVTDDLGNEAVLSFTLKLASEPSILVVPQVASPGDIFQVYYCGWDKLAGLDITIDSYYQKGFDGGSRYILGHNRSWLISIDANGQARDPLETEPTDPPRLYQLRHNDSENFASAKFWLAP